MTKKLTTEEFIKKAMNTHGNRYDYSLVDYKDNKTDIIIICKEHGSFPQNPNSHMRGSGCRICSIKSQTKKRRKTTKQFIDQAKDKHGDRYDYSLVDYKNNKTDIIIICKEHGPFPQKPKLHLNGSGCKTCGVELRASKKRLKIEDFIRRAVNVHGDRYDYSHVQLVSTTSKVKIGCEIHGFFYPIASDHIYKGSHCPDCANDTRSIKNRFSNSDYIKRAKEIHGNRYDYSRVKYSPKSKTIILGCKVHGWFEMHPMSHLNGRGCKDCSIDANIKRLTMTTEQFIKKAIEVHGQIYDYSKVEYKSSYDKVLIGCKKHGFFPQRPNDHLTGHGCNKCINKQEGKIAEYLLKNNIVFREHRVGKEMKFFDFFLPDHNLLIERDGEQHYEVKDDFFSRGDVDYVKKQNENDKFKTEIARKHGYKIARIPYWLNDDQVEREIDNILADNPSYPDVPDLKQAVTKPLPK